MSIWYPLHRHYRHRPPSPDPCSVIIPSRYSTRRNYELMVHWALPRQLRQQQNTNHCRDSSKWWCFVCPQRSYNPLDNHMHKDRILKLFECLNDWGGEDRHPKTQEKMIEIKDHLRRTSEKMNRLAVVCPYVRCWRHEKIICFTKVPRTKLPDT